MRKRLTMKNTHMLSTGHITKENEELFCNCYNKLVQIEDFEEELGIDLVTLFKALNGFYCVEYEYDCKRGYIPEREAGSMSYCPKRRYKPVRDCAITYDSRDHRYKLIPYDPVLREIKITAGFNIEDYGKTWALTKKELEDEDG